MHFSTIVTVIAATMGMTANAAPALQARQNCPANQNAKCCNALVPTLLGGIIVSVGLGCIDREFCFSRHISFTSDLN